MAISRSLIRTVAALVEVKWQRFAVCLERKAGAILQCKEKSDDNLVRAMIIIEDWIAECGQKATTKALVQACEDCGINRDIIEATYKNNSKS